jgi:signal transduction histidine kinase
LPNLVQTIANTLKIPYVAIWLPTVQDQLEVVAEWGKPPEQREMIALIYQNKTIGHLVVSRRGVNEPFRPGERKLLTTIAALTATTVRAVQLSDELRQSRQRIVTAREEERRRIRRDLHDGLGPQLASQTLGLEAIAQLMPFNPQKARSLLESLKSQAREAIQDVRHLVYDLRPPALDDLGLIGALKQNASRYATSNLHFSFYMPDVPNDLPAAVETAIYRIAQEAMTNVVRHAEATHCIVRIYCTNDAMFLEIEDDGCGLPESYQAGIGLQTMRERAAELNGQTSIGVALGGGTRVQARLPLEVSHA